MNKSVAQVARHPVKADRLTEPMLNRVEAVIRCYDPCLSCSTAIGQMPLHLQLLALMGPCWTSANGDRRPGRRLRQLPADRRRRRLARRRAARHRPRLEGAQILARHQLTPELAADISQRRLFVLMVARPVTPARCLSGGSGHGRPPRPAGRTTSTPKPWPAWPNPHGAVRPDRAGQCRRQLVRRRRPPLRPPAAGAVRGRRGSRRDHQRSAPPLSRPCHHHRRYLGSSLAETLASTR